MYFCIESFTFHILPKGFEFQSKLCERLNFNLSQSLHTNHFEIQTLLADCERWKVILRQKTSRGSANIFHQTFKIIPGYFGFIFDFSPVIINSIY